MRLVRALRIRRVSLRKHQHSCRIGEEERIAVSTRQESHTRMTLTLVHFKAERHRGQGVADLAALRQPDGPWTLRNCDGIDSQQHGEETYCGERAELHRNL